MARSELKRRVDALEGGAGRFAGPTIWLVLNPGETKAEGVARWEAVNGPRKPGQPAAIWLCVETGVPRGEHSICA